MPEQDRNHLQASCVATGGTGWRQLTWRRPHYRDLLDNYYLPERYFDALFQLPEIVRNGETRWEFR